MVCNLSIFVYGIIRYIIDMIVYMYDQFELGVLVHHQNSDVRIPNNIHVVLPVIHFHAR